MTPQEFKAWFEGFTEAFTGCPTKAQWARVKERVGEIDGKPITEHVYIDRYIHRYWPPYLAYPHWQTLGGIATCQSLGQNTQTSLQGFQQSSASDQYQGLAQSCGSSFDGLTAMAALGRAEAALGAN